MELSNCKQLEVLHAGVNAIKELAPGLFSRGGGDAPEDGGEGEAPPERPDTAPPSEKASGAGREPHFFSEKPKFLQIFQKTLNISKCSQ